jgi:hypothetical protein
MELVSQMRRQPRILGFIHRFTTEVMKFTSMYVSPVASKHPCTSA